MSVYQLPYIGEINIKNLEEYYDSEDVTVNGNAINLDLNFNNKTIPVSIVDSIKHFLNNIAAFDLQNIESIKKNFTLSRKELEKRKVDINHMILNSTVRDYMEHHLEECDEEELKLLLVNKSDSATQQLEQMLSKLKLVRVGLYPDGVYNTENFAVFDYSIGEEFTNYIVVLKTDAKGDLLEICSES